MGKYVSFLQIIFFLSSLQTAAHGQQQFFLELYRAYKKEKSEREELKRKAFSDFMGYAQEGPASYRCPRIQNLLRSSHDSASYIVKELGKNIDTFDSCIVQALAESDISLERSIKAQSHDPKKIGQKIHYFLTDPKIDRRVQETLRNFYFKTEQKNVPGAMRYVSLKAYAKKDNTHAGTIIYLLTGSASARISNLQVDPAWYRKGIGSTLFIKALSHIESSCPEEKTVDVTFQVKPFRENLSFDELSRFYSSLGASFFDAENEWSKENMVVMLRKELR